MVELAEWWQAALHRIFSRVLNVDYYTVKSWKLGPPIFHYHKSRPEEQVQDRVKAYSITSLTLLAHLYH